MFYFAQDTWRVTSKLTVTYGLRWDTWFPDYSMRAGQGGRYDVTDNLVRIPGVGGISLSGDAKTQWTNFSPRLALAYAFTTKTVVRAGYGRSYYQGTFGWTFNNLAADIYPSIVTQDLRGTSRGGRCSTNSGSRRVSSISATAAAVTTTRFRFAARSG